MVFLRDYFLVLQIIFISGFISAHAMGESSEMAEEENSCCHANYPLNDDTKHCIKSCADQKTVQKEIQKKDEFPGLSHPFY